MIHFWPVIALLCDTMSLNQLRQYETNVPMIVREQAVLRDAFTEVF